MTRDSIEEQYPDSLMIFADGFDKAILGVDSNHWYQGKLEKDDDSKERVVYSVKKMIKILMKESKIDYEEAREFFDYNIAGAYVGVHTPVFCEDEEG